MKTREYELHWSIWCTYTVVILCTRVTCDSVIDNVKQSHSTSSHSSIPLSSSSSASSSGQYASQYISPDESSGGERQSKAAVDMDDWYWQRRWANRAPRRPAPYDSYYSMYPPPPSSTSDRSYYYPSRVNKPLRRTSMSMSAPISAPSSNSYTSTDADGLQGVFAKWNPKINLTWPPTMAFSSTNEYPEYTPSASYHHHHDDDHHYKQIQFIPIHMPCHQDHKKKEISLVWPLIFLGLLFLPLLLGALLLPLAFLFITNIIQLLNLLQRTQGTAPTGTATQTGRRRRRRHLQHHPLIDDKIQLIAHRLEDSLLKFLYLFADTAQDVESKRKNGKS